MSTASHCCVCECLCVDVASYCAEHAPSPLRRVAHKCPVCNGTGSEHARTVRLAAALRATVLPSEVLEWERQFGPGYIERMARSNPNTLTAMNVTFGQLQQARAALADVGDVLTDTDRWFVDNVRWINEPVVQQLVRILDEKCPKPDKKP